MADGSGDTNANTEKPCRVCPEARHMFEAFAKFGKEAVSKERRSSALGTVPPTAGTSMIHEPETRTEATAPTECPPDTEQLGRSTWTFLHTMAAYYPEQPSVKQQELMRIMMAALGEFYPCHWCAEHLRGEMAQKPPAVASNKDLSKWLCDVHNEVNDRLGKPQFDCSKVFERWKDGGADGSCGGPL